jgi:hypothetical protein
MQWFRHYHGMSTDPKLASAAMEAEVHHTMAVAAWCFVLEHASEAEDRGSVTSLSPKVMAVGLRCTKDEAARMLAAFEVEGMLRAGRIVAWEKRQPVSDNVAERVAEHRRRKAQAAAVGASNEPGNGDDTGKKGDVTLPTKRRNVTKHSDQNRTDKIRDSKIHPDSGERVQGENHPPVGGDDPNPPPKRKPDLGTRLPDDWQPSVEDWRFCTEKGLTNGQAREIADEFRDYWLSEPGPRGRKLDWSRTFRNRVRDRAPRLAATGRRAADRDPRDRAPSGGLAGAYVRAMARETDQDEPSGWH